MSGIQNSVDDHVHSTNGMGRYFVLMAVALAAQFLIVVVNPTTVDGRFNPLFLEDGPIEALSPIGYGLCMVLIVALGGMKFAFTRAFSLMVVFLVMMLRELDFHTRFTAMSVTKLKFFTSGEVPVMQKIVAFAVLALIAWAVLHIIFTHGRTFLADLRKCGPMSVAAMLSILMIVSSEALDGISRPLAKIGLPIGPDAAHAFEKVEETLEMGISIFAALAILAYFSGKDHRTDTRT